MRNSRLGVLWLVVLLGSGCAPRARPAAGPVAGGLGSALDSLFADTALSRAHLGVMVRSLRTGEVLYQRNAAKSFVPASNMKLVTGAAAVELLGPDYRYQTSLAAAGPVRAGVLNGDLVVRGSGDPTLSGRFGADPRGVMRAWADSLQARGIRRVAGGIVGVDSAFAGPTRGAGWAWDDMGAGYAAEFGALQFNEGAIAVQVMPGRGPGWPAVVAVDPPTQYVQIDNRATTGPPGSPVALRVLRDEVGPGIAVTGTLPADTSVVVEEVAVRNPTDFFLAVLRETLREAGVAVEGQALAVDEWPEPRRPSAETPLFVHRSPPMREILPAMLKPSQNWIAETLLSTVGREAGGQGSARAGAAVVDSLLRAWSIPTDGLRMADGSGLSRYDLLTPELLVELLTRMYGSAHRDLWIASLPLAGQSGTLAGRMRDEPLRGRVAAKTGTLSGVRSLAGYLTTATGEPIAFAMISNHHLRPSAAVDRVVEAALARIAAER